MTVRPFPLSQLLLLALLLLALPACAAGPGDTSLAADHEAGEAASNEGNFPEEEKVFKTDAEWRQQLDEQQYYVIRQKGTERAFTGRFWDHEDHGTYTCAACGLPLFDSEDKFESGTGWPSYTRPVEERNITEERDVTFGMVRTEILCSRCGGHLGHVFADGPAPTGLRYCVNSASLAFVPESGGS